MTKGALIFEGNEKQVFATDHPDQVIFRYKDVTVAYNNVKRARFKGKGALDNQISAILLDYLNRNGVETHFIEVLGDQEQLCRKIEIIPLQVVVHNRIAGSLAARLGVPEGYRHSNVIVDLRTVIPTSSWTFATTTTTWRIRSSTATTPSPSALPRTRNWTACTTSPAG